VYAYRQNRCPTQQQKQHDEYDIDDKNKEKAAPSKPAVPATVAVKRETVANRWKPTATVKSTSTSSATPAVEKTEVAASSGADDKSKEEETAPLNDVVPTPVPMSIDVF
jgi:hypothetical protein